MWDLPLLEKFGVESWDLVVASHGQSWSEAAQGRLRVGPALGTLCASQVGAQPGPQLDV